MVREDYGSRYDLLQAVIDPTARERLNRAVLDENPYLHEFGSAIEWLSPDRATGK